MSSLPQGWHGAIGPSKSSSSNGVSGSSVPVTIRKKWNSPLSSNGLQTKLPSYKSSNLRHQNLNSTYQIKQPLASCSTTQTKLPTPTKPSPVKEYKEENAKLKKELSTIKAENSILKAKVRRVDDENLQKGRQIEKMKAEIKALQKNDSANSRRSKESQELLSLRQKCSRLETVLKDKDLAIKKLTNECTILRKETDSKKTQAIYNQKQSYHGNSPAQVSKTSDKESMSAKSNLSRTSHTLKTEVTKLRDMIHKLEKENQDLQQQAKQHCLEMRRLKVQLKSKVAQPQPTLKSASSENSKTVQLKTESLASNKPERDQNKAPVFKSPVPIKKSVKVVKTLSEASTQNIQKRDTPKKSIQQKNISKIGRTSSLPNGSIKKVTSTKPVKSAQSKLPVTKSNVKRVPSKPATQKTENNESTSNISMERSDLELRVQEMRENIAAKKIQRSWREHKKYLHHSAEYDFQSKEKALSFIISSMKHHKSRKEKLHILVKRRSYFPENIKKEMFMAPIESVSKSIWDQDMST